MKFINSVVIYFTVLVFGINLFFINNTYLVQKILTYRSDLILDSNYNNIELTFSLNEWASFKDKREIFYKKTYYDIKSYIIYKDKVIVKAVIDKFEIKIKQFIKHLLNNKTKKHSNITHKTKTNFFFFNNFIHKTLNRNLKKIICRVQKKHLIKDYTHYINSDFKPPKQLLNLTF